MEELEILHRLCFKQQSRRSYFTAVAEEIDVRCSGGLALLANIGIGPEKHVAANSEFRTSIACDSDSSDMSTKKGFSAFSSGKHAITA